MTREEAIENLKLLLCQDTRIEADEYEETLKMSIKALEKENEPKTIVNHGTLNIDFK